MELVPLDPDELDDGPERPGPPFDESLSALDVLVEALHHMDDPEAEARDVLCRLWNQRYIVVRVPNSPAYIDDEEYLVGGWPLPATHYERERLPGVRFAGPRQDPS